MADIQERLSVSSSSSSSSSALCLSTAQPKEDSLPIIDGESWIVAEERAHEILRAIQPVVVSDISRNEIIDYLRSLIKIHDGIEVFSFGSVPLKTYLPDGDIDLTVLTKQNMDDELYEQLGNKLKNEESESEFLATDVQFIRAQVKVIKCQIRNIAVDISFNQTAGLRALCFLEQIDNLFGRDHLFKRSIILVKAWCYYESRILGANTGLISTYALAVLVLYIINLFHSSLSGPLAVLYKFLDYYGSFDWNNYCITVTGAVPKSSLPEFMASSEHEHELLLTEKYLRDCLELYSIPTKAMEANGLEFKIRYLNIIDPLEHSNNLGKSVTQGNFQRIRHAFIFGARKLRDVLALPCVTMGWRLEKFFHNSLERNGKGQRQDVNDPVTVFGSGRSELSELSGDFGSYFGRLVYGQMHHGFSLPGAFHHSSIPVSSQVNDQNDWDIVRHVVAYRMNEFYLRCLNVSTSMHQPVPLNSLLTNGCRKTRGTGTYIPEMSQQSYSDRFRESGMGNTLTHHLEASTTEAIDNDGANMFCNLSEVSPSCTSNKGEEETCSDQYQPVLKSPGSENLEIDNNPQSPPPEDHISSSILVLENGKEENRRSENLEINNNLQSLPPEDHISSSILVLENGKEENRRSENLEINNNLQSLPPEDHISSSILVLENGKEENRRSENLEIDNNLQSPPPEDHISSSILVLENGKEENRRSENLEIDNNLQSPPPEDHISSSILVLENGKEENRRSSQTMNPSETFSDCEL